MKRQIVSEWRYKVCYSAYKNNSRGVAVLFRNNFEFEILRIKKDNQFGNFIFFEIKSNEHIFTHIMLQIQKILPFLKI